MKQLWHMIERYYPWLLLLLGVDCFCAVILWISDIQVFQTLIGLVVLTSILLFSAILFVLNKRENTHMELFRDFLSDPTICNEERLLSAISQKEGESVRFLASVLREYKNESNNMADALRDYEEYVEGWAHEAKTPLSLLTMLLDNRNDEISPSLQAKLDYVRSQLQEDVTQMLYYARLKSSTKDYRFEDVNLNDIEEYIYSSEYLNIQNPIEFNEIKNIYNTKLVRYFFDTEKYQSEEDYREIFFQEYLDGKIDKNEYYNAENSFKEFIKYLSRISNVYIYYDFLASIENSYPFQNSSDVNFSLDFIKETQGKFTKIIDKFQLEQVSILFAREIVCGFIVLDDIKSVVICSGMHGCILSVNDLDSELLSAISLQVKVEKISALQN